MNNKTILVRHIKENECICKLQYYNDYKEAIKAAKASVLAINDQNYIDDLCSVLLDVVKTEEEEIFYSVLFAVTLTREDIYASRIESDKERTKKIFDEEDDECMQCIDHYCKKHMREVYKYENNTYIYHNRKSFYKTKRGDKNNENQKN